MILVVPLDATSAGHALIASQDGTFGTTNVTVISQSNAHLINSSITDQSTVVALVGAEDIDMWALGWFGILSGRTGTKRSIVVALNDHGQNVHRDWQLKYPDIPFCQIMPKINLSDCVTWCSGTLYDVGSQEIVYRKVYQTIGMDDPSAASLLVGEVADGGINTDISILNLNAELMRTTKSNYENWQIADHLWTLSELLTKFGRTIDAVQSASGTDRSYEAENALSFAETINSHYTQFAVWAFRNLRRPTYTDPPIPSKVNWPKNWPQLFESIRTGNDYASTDDAKAILPVAVEISQAIWWWRIRDVIEGRLSAFDYSFWTDSQREWIPYHRPTTKIKYRQAKDAIRWISDWPTKVELVCSWLKKVSEGIYSAPPNTIRGHIKSIDQMPSMCMIISKYFLMMSYSSFEEVRRVLRKNLNLQYSHSGNFQNRLETAISEMPHSNSGVRRGAPIWSAYDQESSA